MYRWAAAGGLGFVPARIAVTGACSGGNLAAALTILVQALADVAAGAALAASAGLVWAWERERLAMAAAVRVTKARLRREVAGYVKIEVLKSNILLLIRALYLSVISLWHIIFCIFGSVQLHCLTHTLFVLFSAFTVCFRLQCELYSLLQLETETATGAVDTETGMARLQLLQSQLRAAESELTTITATGALPQLPNNINIANAKSHLGLDSGSASGTATAVATSAIAPLVMPLVPVPPPLPCRLLLAYPVLDMTETPSPSRSLYMGDPIVPLNIILQCRAAYQSPPAPTPPQPPTAALALANAAGGSGGAAAGGGSGKRAQQGSNASASASGTAPTSGAATASSSSGGSGSKTANAGGPSQQQQPSPDAVSALFWATITSSAAALRARAAIPATAALRRCCPLISPALATDAVLGRLPPTALMVGSLDPFVDDTVMWAHRLARVETPVVFKLFDDLPHGFFHFTFLIDDAGKGVDAFAKWMGNA